jgi:hypothetical protein
MNQTLRPLRRERLQSALNTLKRLVEGLSSEDYGQVDRPRLLLPMKDYSFILFRWCSMCVSMARRSSHEQALTLESRTFSLPLVLSTASRQRSHCGCRNGCPSLCCILHRTAPSITLPNIFILPWPV